MKSFSRKVAAVTGAGSGIGRALSMDLARRGCDLALADVDEGGLAGTVEAARRLGVKVSGTRVDVAEREAVHAWADQAAAEHGGVNLIFNNAGVALGSTIEGGGYEDFEWLFRINFWGVVNGTKAFLPHLKSSGEGHVVNVSSVFALISVPGQGAYNASKSAVRGFTEALRMELELSGAPVSATSVHPGGIKTNVARSARSDESLRSLGVDPEESRKNFEKLFITEPEKAAQTILCAVQKDKRRVLVGPDAYVIDGLARLLPGAYQTVVKKLVMRSMR
ncbi:SDR family NAD(P)-dependent oxidoreductase [Rubrobacter marinus]|uniref:SDR family NAD(P)-dependent oxidoreductase n=1 Tax=Rubrobacter marinus TaxID=2653852 RepID=A0A6G8PYB2_9ACTN|nr:SDR family NAD(P)-dependent oxidoreductase [Rubrobacter marinus]QIN79148.1 SDR family NAD(P)-dependent oxidoreductase [Rubrobacter marinus]